MKQLAGRVGYADKGNYSPTETYDYLDVVYYNGSSYVAKKLTTGNTPEADSEYWHVFATGSAITGVKGNNESTYRTGQVNLTAENIGAFPETKSLDNNADLNLLIKPGFYFKLGANTVLNGPPTNGAMTLMVLKSGAPQVIQIAIFAQSTNVQTVYMRYYYQDGSWTSWIYCVSGIKGARETTYRGGNVNLTAANIGAVEIVGTAVFKLGVENGLLYYEEV